MAKSTTSFNGKDDIYEQILDHYEKSLLPQHGLLCKTGASIHAIIYSKSLPLTPLSYFTTIIDALSDTTQTYDAVTVGGLSSLLAIVLPLVPYIHKSKAYEAAMVLTELLSNQFEGLLSLVECLGILLECCNLDDWESIELGFKALLKHSIHTRPKVRECAQNCVVKVFKSFKSSFVKNIASRLVLESLQTYVVALAIKTIGSKSADGVSKCEYLEVLHMIDLLKFLIPCLPTKIIPETIVELQKCLSAKFLTLTSHVLDIMEEILRFFESESQLTEADTLKIPNKWIGCYSLVITSIAGLLTYEEAIVATRALRILKEMINRVSIFQNDESKDTNLVKSLCDSLLAVLSTENETPNEHCLSVISELFEDLGIYSYTFMNKILLKLATFMSATGDVKHLQECLGSAVSSMGPEKVFSLIPIAFDEMDFTCSNTWLIPILKEYTDASSIGFFVECILPLAKSLQEANETLQAEKKLGIGEQLHSYARGCWGLLPSFCRHPIDMDPDFECLADHMISYIKNDAFMLEDIALALQHLVKENTDKCSLDDYEASWYRENFGTGNIKVLSSCSEELLKAFTEVLFKVSPEKHAFVKDAIACLTLITEPSAVFAIFISSVKKTNPNVSVDQVASVFVGETSIDPIDFIYNSIKNCLQEEEGNIQMGSYATIYKILEESSNFRSSKFEQLIHLLLNLKSPEDVTSLIQRFLCFKTLLVHHSIEITSERENTYACGMLKEILGILKHSKEGSRQVAKDTLLDTSSILQKTQSSSEMGPYCEFITMIMDHLSGYTSYITSGAVSALSLLISNDSKICYMIPDLVPTILELLYGEDIHEITAVLGFLEVLVLSLQVRDLQNFLSDILGGLLPFVGLLPFSYFSQHRFKSNVMFILEIMIQKCGSSSVKSLVPKTYQDFVENVLENPQGEASSAEDVKASSAEDVKWAKEES